MKMKAQESDVTQLQDTEREQNQDADLGTLAPELKQALFIVSYMGVLQHTYKVRGNQFIISSSCSVVSEPS